MLRRHLLLLACLASLLTTCQPTVTRAQPVSPRWTAERARDWYARQPWFCGFNYIPSNAINYTAMWDKTSFSPKLIQQELALAARTGFNCVRVVLQHAVYADDPAYFKRTFAQFLSICQQHGMRVMPTFFDDCVFGTVCNPHLGPQPEPLAGWYAWAWSPSPGHTMVADPAYHAGLARYVTDILTTFRDDPRIFIWDLYNEPTNGGLGRTSLPLLRKVFAWARAVDPSQPVTVGHWERSNAALRQEISANSDIVTFHCYDRLAGLTELVDDLKQANRPLLCTEWLNRSQQSTPETILPYFQRERIGCLHWGLVNGKTQTHLPWGHRPGDPEPTVWQHDLYHADFTPYRPAELRLFNELITQSAATTKR
ncbi:cellulase family glycosylhydrolase [uncultured Spirosoma sp.]|uniref:cellulase family glycosylhydrolase n=1 Tax=uncultured Spirosoma sp. TaxID=278208 RepID=UPI00258B5AAD|nr:cellulase family glycosylhydrolase [uncultured Spirosoma sp.]